MWIWCPVILELHPGLPYLDGGNLNGLLQNVCVCVCSKSMFLCVDVSVHKVYNYGACEFVCLRACLGLCTDRHSIFWNEFS